MFYDTLLFGTTILIAGAILSTLITRAMGWENMPPDSPLAKFLFLSYFLMAFGLFGWFWTHGGQTLGMRAWKIRVVTMHGQPLNWQHAFFRFVGALISWTFVGAGFLIALADPEQLTWHDRFSRTRLIRV
jgi:uncharacterized RDD family membrane protein YckC